MNIPVFITGYERSGTSLLRRIISMHPHMPYELIHERPDLLMSSSTREEAIKKMTYPGTQEGKKTGTTMSIIAGQKIPYLTFERGSAYIQQFRKLFPESLIIHIVRNPVYAINSQIKTFHHKFDICVKNYFESVPKIVNLLFKMENVWFVNYENIIENPSSEIYELYTKISSNTSNMATHIATVISTRRPWRSGDKVMCGLRYFDKIQNTNPQLVLSCDQIEKINKLNKEIDL